MGDFVKHDAGKVRLELLPMEALQEVGAVLTFGATKYPPNNWRRGTQWSRYVGAALRHIFAWSSGEDRDPETGRSHLAHAVCCLLFLITHQLTDSGEDDRWKNTTEL